MRKASQKLQNYQISEPYSPYESPDTPKKSLISYKKLVVPTRMRSVYWKYFGFPADLDGSIITKDKIVCTLCKSQLINNHNTSNLRMHLMSKHKQILAQIDPAAMIKSVPTVKPKKSKYSEYAFGGLGIPKKYETREVQIVVSEENNEHDISDIAMLFPNQGDYQTKTVKEPVESKEITNIIVNFIISDLIPPDVVDGAGFHCLISNLSNRETVIPNEKSLVNDILPTMFNSCKEQLSSTMQMSTISNLSLSLEEWSCANCVKCISIYAHFTQNVESTMKTRLLKTISYAGCETESYWTGVLDRLLQDWLIDVNFVTAVIVSFSNDSLLKAIKAKNLLIVPCFMSVIQQLCDKYCFHQSQIEPILEKCRKLVKYLQDKRTEFQHSITFDKATSEDEGFEYGLGADKRGLWLTTYYMLESLIRRRSNIEEAILNFDRELVYVIPLEEEWKIVTDLVALLEPLKTIVITLFEEKNSLISLLKPLLWKVCSSSLELDDKDSSLTRELKQKIKRMLNDAYEEQEVNNLTQIATVLDPRFKHFIAQEGSMDIEATLVELLTNFINVEGDASPKVSVSEPDSTPKKTSRLSGINSLLGNICVPKSTMSLQDKIKAEINQYQSHSSVALEQCPLDWWASMSNKCPNMSRLANRYHCIPAVVTHTGNYTVLEYIKFHQKRSILNVEIADALLFLHSNKNVL